MPDRWGFNHLGTLRRCIVPGCGEGGEAWEWPEERRRGHQEEHRNARRREANDAAAERLQHWREEHHT